MTKSSGQNTQAPETPVNNSIKPEAELDTTSQKQPEQQSQAHESSEGQRRALQLIEEYADDIDVDEYDFDDEILIQSQLRDNESGDERHNRQ